tara:strand:+ start:367 stop:1671 length:1305 start_codon:yes stop_codon:yes gene_type:complete
VIRIFYFILLCIFVNGCSLNSNSKFWTNSKAIKKEKNINYKKVFYSEKIYTKELNPNLRLKLDSRSTNQNKINELYNNNKITNLDGILKKSKRYSFSKIDDFSQYQPEISFLKDGIIFFDNKGSILKFNSDSKLVWKKNYYSKSEKKLKPILQFANNGKFLIVTDNIAKYYMLNIENGNLIWSKNNFAPFNSQIKIYDDKFFTIDFSNTLRCFSLKDGAELWNVKTENTLIRSQKKLSMVIVSDQIYFNNSIGDISAVDIKNGELLWQLPTQSSLIYESAFSLQTSDIVSDNKSLFFSNNKNQLFSIDLRTGTFNWKNRINSNIRSSILGNYLISLSLEGFLIITDKKSGNIIKITDVFKNFETKKRIKIKPTGFILGVSDIYISTSNGRLIIIDFPTGAIKEILKIDSEKISRPFAKNKSLFLIKDNAIIKLN